MNSQWSTEHSEGYHWTHPPADLPRSGRPIACPPDAIPANPPTQTLSAMGLPLRGRILFRTPPWVVLAPLGRPMATHGEPSGFKR